MHHAVVRWTPFPRGLRYLVDGDTVLGMLYWCRRVARIAMFLPHKRTKRCAGLAAEAISAFSWMIWS